MDVIPPSVEAMPDLLRQKLSHNPDIKGLFVTSSITGEVAAFLKSQGLKQSLVLVGYDLVPENRKALADGSIDCIISQRPAYQGYTGVYQLYKHEGRNAFIQLGFVFASIAPIVKFFPVLFVILSQLAFTVFHPFPLK